MHLRLRTCVLYNSFLKKCGMVLCRIEFGNNLSLPNGWSKGINLTRTEFSMTREILVKPDCACLGLSSEGVWKDLSLEITFREQRGWTGIGENREWKKRWHDSLPVLRSSWLWRGAHLPIRTIKHASRHRQVSPRGGGAKSPLVGNHYYRACKTSDNS